MSRSRRTTPVAGHTSARDDGPGTQQSARQRLASDGDGDAVPDRRLPGSPYGLKDGRHRPARPRPEGVR